MNIIAWLTLGNLTLMIIAIWQLRIAIRLVESLKNIHDHIGERSDSLLSKYFQERDKDERNHI